MCGQCHFSHHIVVMGNLFKVRLFGDGKDPTASDQTVQPHLPIN